METVEGTLVSPPQRACTSKLQGSLWILSFCRVVKKQKRKEAHASGDLSGGSGELVSVNMEWGLNSSKIVFD